MSRSEKYFCLSLVIERFKKLTKRSEIKRQQMKHRTLAINSLERGEQRNRPENYFNFAAKLSRRFNFV